jgi:peptidyl-prolyl cis-trans isomerase SurA
VDSLIRQAQPTPDPASEPDAKDRPVALVDGTPILASELKAAIAMEKVYLEYRYSSAPSKLKSELAEMQLTQLDTLINMRLLVNEFKKRKGEIPKAYIEEDLNDTVRDNYHGDRAAFEDYLTRCGMTLERYRVWREQLMMEGSMRDRFAGEVKITDIEQVEDYYKAHPQRWRGAEEVKLNSITLLKTLHETDAETRAQMESLREQIAQGEVFASIARAQSKDSHAEDGGAWGWTSSSAWTTAAPPTRRRLKK